MVSLRMSTKSVALTDQDTSQMMQEIDIFHSYKNENINFVANRKNDFVPDLGTTSFFASSAKTIKVLKTCLSLGITLAEYYRRVNVEWYSPPGMREILGTLQDYEVDAESKHDLGERYRLNEKNLNKKEVTIFKSLSSTRKTACIGGWSI